MSDPLRVIGAVSLAGPGQLGPFRDLDNQVCGMDIIDELMGGSPEDAPANYAAGSPIRLLPLDVPQVLITGVDDPAVPPRFADDYAVAARSSGDEATSVTLDGASHFEVIAPTSGVWPQIKERVLHMFRRSEP